VLPPDIGIPAGPAIPGPATPVLENPFSDVPTNYWAANEIITLYRNGIVFGQPDGTFKPREEITRGEVADIIARALKLLPDGNSTKQVFLDVPVDYKTFESISCVNVAGIMQGDGNGYFRPNAPISREELVKVIMVIVNKKNLVEAPLSTLERFKDRDKIAKWAKNYVAQATLMGIVNGVSKDLFSPNTFASRDQVVALVYRILKILDKAAD